MPVPNCKMPWSHTAEPMTNAASGTTVSRRIRAGVSWALAYSKRCGITTQEPAARSAPVTLSAAICGAEILG